MKTFKAPWGLSLKLVTLFVSTILIVIPVVGLTQQPPEGLVALLAMTVIPLFILIIAAFYSIFSYRIQNNELLVRRLLWNTSIDLSTLDEAFRDPEAMKYSRRLFGNGGLFCFAGLFKNKKLGKFRALATHPTSAVVLKFTDRKPLVVTPDRPQDMVETLKAFIK